MKENFGTERRKEIKDNRCKDKKEMFDEYTCSNYCDKRESNGEKEKK